MKMSRRGGGGEMVVMGQEENCVPLKTMTRDDLLKLCPPPHAHDPPHTILFYLQLRMMGVFQGVPVGLRSISPAV